MNKSRNWLNWWYYAAIRAIKTAIQTGVAMIPVSVSVQDVDWLMILITALLSALCSLLTSLPGIPEEEMPPTQPPDDHGD